MTQRGLYFCSIETCILAPEVWPKIDGKMFGLCLKHAIENGFCEALSPKCKPEKKKSFLQELLDEIEMGRKLEADVMSQQSKTSYWWDDNQI